MKKYRVDVCFSNRIYGGMPKGKNLLTKFVESKGEIPEETMAEKVEVLDLEEELEMSRTGFRRNAEGHIFLRDFQIMACMKQAIQTLDLFKKNRGLKGYMEAAVRISPREIVVMDNDGQPISEPTGVDEIQGRVWTMQGPRSILSEKEYIEGAWITFSVQCLVQNDKGNALAKALPDVVALMGNIGLGSSRSRLEGKFEIMAIEEIA